MARGPFHAWVVELSKGQLTARNPDVPIFILPFSSTEARA